MAENSSIEWTHHTFNPWRGCARVSEFPHEVLERSGVGTTTENQAAYDRRVGALLRTPAVMRFLSVEPIIGPIGLRLGGSAMPDYSAHDPLPAIDWIIVGGESGPGARPCDLAWVRSIVQQCQAAGVPVFVKQVGALPMMNGVYPDGCSIPSRGGSQFGLRDRKGGDPGEWPEDLRVREVPSTARAVGGSAAARASDRR